MPLSWLRVVVAGIVFVLGWTGSSRAEIGYASQPIVLTQFLTPEVFGVAVDHDLNVYFVLSDTQGYVKKIQAADLSVQTLFGPGPVNTCVTWANNTVFFSKIDRNTAQLNLHAIPGTGGPVTPIFSEPVFSYGQIVDRRVDNKIWYTDQTNNQIRFWDGSTSNSIVGGTCNYVLGLVQETTGSITWANWANNEAEAGSIWRYKTDGTFQKVIENLTDPRGLAIDRLNNLHFTQNRSTGYAIQRLSAEQTVNNATPITLIDGLNLIRRIAVDRHANLYWSDAVGGQSVASRICTLPKLESHLWVSPSSVTPGETITLVMTLANHGLATLKNISVPSVSLTTSTTPSSNTPLPTPPSIESLPAGESIQLTWNYTLPADLQGEFKISAQAKAETVASPATVAAPVVFPWSQSNTVVINATDALPAPFLYAIPPSTLAPTAGYIIESVELKSSFKSWQTITTESFSLKENSLSVTVYIEALASENGVYPLLEVKISAPGYFEAQYLSFTSASQPGYYKINFANPLINLQAGSTFSLTLYEKQNQLIRIRYGQRITSLASLYCQAVRMDYQPEPVPTPTPRPGSTQNSQPTLLLDANKFYPDRNPLTIQFSPVGSTPALLCVYDVLGKNIRTLERVSGSANESQNTVWDGRDNKGRTVAPGVYFIQLTVGSVRERKKVVLMR